MKKIAAILLTALTVIYLTACGGEKKSTEGSMSDTGNTTENISEEAASKVNDSAESTLSKDSTEQSGDGDTSETIAENVQTNEGTESESVNEAEEMKILVAYFSATNTTEGVAETIADSLSADIYEIVPEQPYTDDDLNYHDDNSRSTIEMNDSSTRPAISGSVKDMGQYEIVFIGYPIWWGDAPRILSTFVESYDFAGKTIVPFCTSGGSGVGSSATNLEALTDGATWLDGTRLNGGSSHETIVDWVNSLGLDIKAE
ncbi:MAG: flavodoxin [Lachnospiraceae bacterium]|nr:flavodoxin [Lachnospiraceae bacterium]